MSIEYQQSVRILADHFTNLHNRGPLPDANIVATGGDPGCGHALTMYAIVDANGRVERAAFDGEGCSIALAAASYVTELVRGMTLVEVEDLPFETLFDHLDRDILQTRPHCATLALSILKHGVHAHRMHPPSPAASAAENS